MFAKQTQTGGAGGNEKECIHIVQSVQKSLAFVDEIRVEKIFVFVWQVAKCTESEREWVSSRRKKHHHWQEILNLSVANRICQETGTFFPLSRHHVRCFYLFPNVMRRDSLLKHINQIFLFTTTTFFHPRATRIKYIFMTFFGRDMHSTSIHSDVALFPPPSNVVFNHGFSSMEYSVHGEKIDFWALARDLIASTLPICRCTAHFWQNQVHQNPLDSENRYIWKCRILNFINQKLNILTETVLIAAFKWTNRFIAFVCTLSPPNSLFMRCFFSPSILIVDH